MWPQRTETSALRYLARVVPLWILGNTFVFVTLSLLLGFQRPFLGWVFNQIVGLCIEITISVLIYVFKVRGFWGPTLTGVAVCLASGKLVAYWLGWPPPWLATFVEWRPTLVIVGLAFSITPTTTYYFYSRDRLAELEAARKDAELRRVQQENLVLVTHLQTLQAQIEPRFLFNTLANLHSLIESDPLQARTLLERLNDHLRASLDHSRSKGSTLGDECRLLASYLEIQALRLGGRLSWALEVPEDLQTQPLPPMLLQPLVEDALIHGVEPKVGPGRIEITARRIGGRLCLAVGHDGAGHPHGGEDLDALRERLRALFGPEAAMLTPADEAGQGGLVRTELWIPIHQVA